MWLFLQSGCLSPFVVVPFPLAVPPRGGYAPTQLHMFARCMLPASAGPCPLGLAGRVRLARALLPLFD
eukprot:9195068-Alexandrium_andersonii.AAC.1